MAFEMPLDQIKQLQILLREKASLSWYQPEKEGNLALPKLPSVAETVSKLDPSPPNLRCKNCNGRLLRGLQSFMCVFCGTNPHEDLPPDPIKFKNSIGYRWLLESLHLDGSVLSKSHHFAPHYLFFNSLLIEFCLLNKSAALNAVNWKLLVLF